VHAPSFWNLSSSDSRPAPPFSPSVVPGPLCSDVSTDLVESTPFESAGLDTPATVPSIAWRLFFPKHQIFVSEFSSCDVSTLSTCNQVASLPSPARQTSCVSCCCCCCCLLLLLLFLRRRHPGMDSVLVEDGEPARKSSKEVRARKVADFLPPDHHNSSSLPAAGTTCWSSPRSKKGKKGRSRSLSVMEQTVKSKPEAIRRSDRNNVALLVLLCTAAFRRRRRHHHHPTKK